MSPVWGRRPLTCPEVGRLLQRHLDGEIDEVKARRITRHLADCRRCGMRAGTYTAIKRSLGRRRARIPPDAVEALAVFARQLAEGKGPGEDSASA